MSAIDWDREFEEPWRSIGKWFVSDLKEIAAGRDVIPLAGDKRLLRLTTMTRAEIATAAHVSERSVDCFAIGEIPVESPTARKIRAVLNGELIARP